jgi:subtilisin family serine protease
MRYVILKADLDTLRVRGDVLGDTPDTEALRGADLSVEAHELSPGEVRDVRRAPEVLEAVPSVPVQLVSPLPVAADEPANEDDSTWGVAAVGAPRSPYRGAGATVAILDTGIDNQHEAFRGMKLVEEDFTGQGSGDDHGHGTHCAGTVFGRNVDGLRIGVAPGVETALIGKVLDHEGRGRSEQVVDGLIWAVRNGARVVSMSIGIDFTRLVDALMKVKGFELAPATSQALSAYGQTLRLFDRLAGLVSAHSSIFGSAIVVAAAGNESKRPRYEIATAPPAASDGFISVGALQLEKTGTGRALGVADFSNALPDLSAPGVNIKSARVGGGLISMNGTSMATPHVAGVAALWLEYINTINPNANIRQLEGRLMGSTTLDHVANPKHRANAGAGLVQAPRPAG